jgi:hypothetical protein
VLRYGDLRSPSDATGSSAVASWLLVQGTKEPRFNLKPGQKGAKGQNRTADTAVFSRVLYRLSYLGKRIKEMAGRRNRTRTCDLLGVNEAL